MTTDDEWNAFIPQDNGPNAKLAKSRSILADLRTETEDTRLIDVLDNFADILDNLLDR